VDHTYFITLTSFWDVRT